MLNSIEPRRVGAQRSSENMSLGRDSSEFNALPIINQQAAWLRARFPVGDAHARLLAELVFARRALR